MSQFIINGPNKLSGKVTPGPNKNSAVALIPASILASEKVTITNFPKTLTIKRLLKVYKSLGGGVEYFDDKVVLDPTTIDTHIIPQKLARLERGTLLFMGPLLYRFGKVEIEGNGGCKLGNRPVDTLIQNLIELGAAVDPDNIYKATVDKFKGKDIWQLEQSVTGTEVLIMAAVVAKGKTEIYNAACEPHVQQLCRFLNEIGADISGIGTNKLRINGVSQLSGGKVRVESDFIITGGLIVGAAITGGHVEIENCDPHNMTYILKVFEKLSLQYEIQDQSIIVNQDKPLKAKKNLKGDIDKIIAQPWPSGFPMDLIPQAVLLASMAEGNIRILNNMYETQLTFVDKLILMRAKLILADPARVITLGKSDYKGANISAPKVIQCAHATVLAGLVAEGRTEITNTEHIARRYEDLAKTFRDLGADIEEVE